MRLSLLLTATLFALPAFAAEECTITQGSHDRVAKTGNLIIEPGQDIDDAIAVDGTVIIRAGAKVKSAVSLHGSVMVEDGGEVTKTALAIGGQVLRAPTAKVASVVVISDQGLQVKGAEGDDFSFNFTIDGKSLGQRIVEEAQAKAKRCTVKPASKP